MKVQAIVPTAGIGARFKSTVPKSLIPLNGKPLFVHALEVLEKSNHITSIILVAPREHLSEFEKNIRKYRLRKVTRIIEGGETRFRSVYKGVKVLDEDTEIVLIHDGARPLVTDRIVDGAITLCYTDAAIVVGVPVKPTIKRVEQESEKVIETLDRSELWEAQTPQVFKKDLLVKAYESSSGDGATDDAALIENMGIAVRMMEGDCQNIKITTPEDLNIAEALLKLRQD